MQNNKAMTSIGLRYRRLRIKPKLTEKPKASRLECCLNNSNTKSPDLNPIEMIWAELKNHFRKKLLLGKKNIAREIYNFQRSLSPDKCARYIGLLKKVKCMNKK